MKARPVPYLLKAEVETELDRLQSEGILFEGPEPIVPVVKQDGTVGIFGKITSVH